MSTIARPRPVPCSSRSPRAWAKRSKARGRRSAGNRPSSRTWSSIPPARRVAACPLDHMEKVAQISGAAVVPPAQIFPGRVNAKGWDLTDAGDFANFIAAIRAPALFFIIDRQ